MATTAAPPRHVRPQPALPPGPEHGVLAKTVALHRDPLGTLREAVDRYGPIFTLRLATARPIVAVTEPSEVARLVTADPGHAEAGSPRRPRAVPGPVRPAAASCPSPRRGRCSPAMASATTPLAARSLRCSRPRRLVAIGTRSPRSPPTTLRTGRARGRSGCCRGCAR